MNHTTHQALIIIDMQRGMADRMADRMAAAVVGVLDWGFWWRPCAMPERSKLPSLLIQEPHAARSLSASTDGR
ncbi:MAG TPA: hypothetical protein VIK56_06845 [Rhodoferax sp.]